MSNYISGAIQITAAILFIALMIGAVLAQLEIWTPKDARTKNRLWLALLVPLIAFGVSFIRVPPSGSDSVNQASPARPTAPPPSPAKGAGNSITPTTGQDEAKVPTPPEPAVTESSIPSDISAWATQHLGERPTFSADFTRQYPPCVAALREPTATPTPADVRACTRALDRHHATYIVGYYTVKRPYDEALDRSEAALRDGGVAEEELASYDYVRDEIDRLNGRELDKVSAAEARFAADRNACRTNRCRLPS